MLNQVSKPIAITLKPSKLLLACYTLIVLLAVASVLMTVEPFWLSLMLIIVIIITGLCVVLRDALQMLPWSWKEVCLNSKHELTLIDKQGRTHHPQLDKISINFYYLSILNFKREKGMMKSPLPLMLIADNVTDLNQLRQLRIWLRWGKHTF